MPLLHGCGGERSFHAYEKRLSDGSVRDPTGAHVIADLRGIFGPSETAQMTYCETARGAKVFASGAFSFESPQSGVTDRMLRNLWFSLGRP